MTDQETNAYEGDRRQRVPAPRAEDVARHEADRVAQEEIIRRQADYDRRVAECAEWHVPDRPDTDPNRLGVSEEPVDLLGRRRQWHAAWDTMKDLETTIKRLQEQLEALRSSDLSEG